MELPEVTQRFDADVSGYLAGIEEMIAATDQFRESVDAALVSVEALHAAIDDLPTEKTIHINLETSGVPAAAAAGAGAGAPDTAGMAAEAAATEAAGAAADDADAKFRGLSEAEDAAAAAAARDAAALSAEAAAAHEAGDAADGTAASLGRIGETVGEATIPLAMAGDAAREVGIGLEEAGGDAERTAAGFGLLGAAAAGIVNGFARVEETWKNTNVVWGLSLNALHWIVMGSMEVLAVAVPALVAFGAASLVAMQGVQETGNRLEASYTTTEALGDAFNTTGGEALGLKGNLQAAQDAADPQIWELLGAGLRIVGEQSQGFVTMGSQVIGVLDRFAAELTVELNPKLSSFAGQLDGIASKGVSDLTAFGQAFGNLGHFIVNLASEMPGLAEVLLGAVAGFTKLLAVLTNPAWYNFGGNLVSVAMGIEEAWRWGGLLSNVLGSMLGKFANLVMGIGGFVGKIGALGSAGTAAATAMETMGGGIATAAEALSGPWGWVIMGAVAGLALLTIKLATTRTAAQQFADGLQNAVNSSDMTDAFTKIGGDLTQLQGKMQQTGVAADHTATLVTASGSSFKGLGASVGTAIEAYNAYSGTSSTMIKQSVGLIDAGEKISSQFKISLPAAFEAADMAGVKVGTMFQKNGQISAVALQQIQNFIDGYRVMSGNATALGNNINAVNVQLGLQNTKVGQLNQAWDQFTANATGGTSAWAAFNNDLQQMGDTAGVVGNKITAFSGKTAIGVKEISQALTSFSGTSAQVWQSFDASITQANTNLDWWRTAAASGAASGKQLTEATATTAGAFLPYVKNSQSALAETMMLAQQQGGPAYNSSKSLAQNYQALSGWVQQNSVSQNQYNGMLAQATTALSNVNQQAQQFSQTLRGDVSQAIITGSGALATVTKDTQSFSTALKNNVPQSDAVSSAVKTLTGDLVRNGYDAQSAGSMIYQLGVQQGLTKGQAYTLEQQAIRTANALIQTGNAATQAGGKANAAAGEFSNSAAQLWRMVDAANAAAGAINAIPTSKTTNYYVNTDYAHIGAAGGFSSGGRIPGYGGGDVHPALLEGGETVVPKELTPAVAPLMRAHGIPGFAGGGIMGSDGGYVSHAGFGGGGAQPLHIHLELNGNEIASALIPSLTSASGKYSVRNSGKATGIWRPV